MAQQPHGPIPDPESNAPDVHLNPDADTSSASEAWPATSSSGAYSGAAARDPKDFPGQSSFQPLAPPAYDTPAARGPEGKPVSRTAAMVAGIAVAVIVLIIVVYAFMPR